MIKTKNIAFLAIVVSLIFSGCASKKYLGHYEYAFHGPMSSFFNLHLEKDKSFTFQSHTGISGTRGFGEYSIENDTIYLNYYGMPDSIRYRKQENGVLKFEKTANPTNAHSLIKIKVITVQQLDTLPLVGFSSNVQSRIEQKTGDIDLFKGEVEYKILKREFPVSAAIHFLGFDSQELEFEVGDFDYSVLVKLNEIPPEAIGWLNGKRQYPIKMVDGKFKISNMTKVE